ncbi:pyridine nucleotide-disulfide oxidoreductase [Mycobacterium sp. 852013-50091_SCH5140682]|uniref:FAD-dependent oxidoreductase n=1 Tax=Mycobacterium sp. 852013-50091_SCH5140682 TaxID=1834109 RepID=UPI0007EB0F3B|nr:FAD-dependent oxidoreductase [Mycobacterium sp. 852013-50091_SCH5140682]OBC15408.1 pyridine nucleotide-disulfide oxidoreductase [Mycobacterium sp. 852013-50091_SCH5140682]
MSERQVDLAVIGFGKGGKTLAAALGGAGWRVAMIEQSAQMYGGTCINVGCVPTKSLVYRSEHLGTGSAHDAQYHDAVVATAELTAGLRAGNFAMLDRLATVEVITGAARFVDAHTVAVTTADDDEVTVTATWIVIGTGSRPTFPDLPGLATSPLVRTSTDLLVEENLPQRLVVLGGGYVGLEFAAMYAAYGSEVTVLERHDQVLAAEDDDVAEVARKILQDKGIHVITGARVTGVHDTVTYRYDGAEHTAPADAVLVALGREPVTAELNLQAAGVHTTPSGAVPVDDHLHTNQPHIFAIGDVNGGPQFTYISLDDYRIVLDQLIGAGARSTADRSAVPYALFMTPPLARVGLTERAARDAGLNIKVAAMNVAEMATVPRARIVGEPVGRMKVVVDATTDLILGAALLSHDSHEVINTVALAMRHGITATALRDSIYTHPSMTEAFNQLLSAL